MDARDLVIANAIATIQSEMARLREEHSEALKSAVYIGMNTEELRVRDERMDKLALFCKVLALLESQRGPIS